MRLVANESTVPRLHLIGTLAIVISLTLGLGAFFSWRSVVDQRASLARMAQTATGQQQARLAAEMSSALSYLEFSRSRTEAVLRSGLIGQVDTAMQIVEAIYEKESPRRSQEDVKQLIIEALRPVRFFEGRGYYFIDDSQGKFILLPIAPQLEGNTLIDNRDDTGHHTMRGLIEAAGKPRGEGFSRYRWYTPEDPKKMSDKLAYVRRFAPYDWVIGTGDYTHKWEQSQKQEVISRLRGLRFGNSGYIGLLDRDGRSLLSPANASLEGKPVKDMPPVERAALEKIYQLAGQGGGYIHYEWPDPETGKTVSKTGLVRVSEPWGWTLIATLFDDEINTAFNAEMAQHESGGRKSLTDLLIALAAALTVGLAASYLFSLWLRKLFTLYHEQNLAQSVALKDSKERYRTLVEWSPESILVHRNGEILYANSAALQMFGAADAQSLMGKFTRELIHPDYLEGQMARMKSINDKDTIRPMVESRFLKLDGTAIDVEVQGTSIVYDGEPAIHVSIRDITERKQAEAQSHLAASVFTHAREGIMITSAQGNIIDINEAFSRITGYNRQDVLGQNPRILSSGRQTNDYYADMWSSLTSQGYWFGEVWNRKKNGELFAVMETISAVRDAEGRTQQYVSLFSDITTLKDHQLQLENLAHFDALTHLPNRVLLADRLRQGMTQAHRRGQLLAVVFLDLDGFKAINDQHGHGVGDQLLVALANRMKLALREGDTLARMGGDEFVAVLADLPDVPASVPLLSRLLGAAALPVPVGSLTLKVSASLGVTFYPQADEVEPDQLLRQADQAMYQAKLAGKNRYHLFDAEQDRSVRGHHESLEHIRHAVAEHQLVLYYQPKVNMRTGEVIGAEALIRWQHPQQGLLLPGVFLPVIEDHPLAIEVGEWVIDTALTQMTQWKAAGFSIPISVNVGARQLLHPQFVHQLQTALAEHPAILPGELELEVLETSALEDLKGASRVINACRAFGVTFALDDFGTGYSSLTYLKRLPVTLLKIDQSFVRDMLDDPDDLAILEGVIGMARAFRREVIAEGVETVALGARLLQLGCELGQGFGIARPMPADALQAWSKQWTPDVSWSAQACAGPSTTSAAALNASTEAGTPQ